MKSISKALLSVVRLDVFKSEVGITKNALLSKATGFLYKNSSGQLYLITNKHVVHSPGDDYYPDFLLAYVRTGMNAPSKTKDIRFELYNDRVKMWGTPAGKRVDVAALRVDEDMLKGCFVAYLSNQDVLPAASYFELGSQAVVLGFPKGGFYDEFSNFPIARVATIATLPWLAFNKRRCFLVDAKLHEGMSGSPVVSLPRSVYQKNSEPICDDVNSYLLGIFSSEWLWGDEPLGLNTVWPPELIEEATQEGN